MSKPAAASPAPGSPSTPGRSIPGTMAGLALIVACLAVGELITRGFGLLIPGAVIGIALLFVALFVSKGSLKANLESASESVLSLLPLLFIPAGTGLIAFLSLLVAQAPAMLVALVVSWFVGTLITALAGVVVFVLLPRWRAKARS